MSAFDPKRTFSLDEKFAPNYVRITILPKWEPLSMWRVITFTVPHRRVLKMALSAKPERTCEGCWSEAFRFV
jgi:hypothetical protein